MLGRPLPRALAVLLALTLGSALAVFVSEAHEDVGEPQRVNDSVKVTEVTALSDQDDGGGDSEYCIRVTVEHPSHISKSESVDCKEDINWDDTAHDSEKTWEELKRLPLIGEGGYFGPSWEGPEHENECVSSAAWIVKVRLSEADTAGIDKVLAEIGKALQQANVTGALGPKVFLAGVAAEIAAKVLNQIFSGETDLGEVPMKWESGEGDPAGTVAKNPKRARHFSASGEKTVTPVTPKCKPSTDTTPSTPQTTPPPPPPTDTTPTDTTPTDTTPTDTTPTGTTTGAVPFARAAQQRPPCGADLRHVFCTNAARARSSWRSLRRAVRAIARVRHENGGHARYVTRTRRRLLRLVRTIARTSVTVELSDARARTSSRARRVRRRARAHLRRGDRLSRAAVRRVDPALLSRSLGSYRRAYTGLVRLVHPSSN